MSKYTKSPCERCGKDVTDFAPIRKKHDLACVKACKRAETHKAAEEMVNIDPEQRVAELRREAAKAAQAATPEQKPLADEADFSNVKDPVLRKQMEVAWSRQELYKEAPKIFVAEDSCDEFMELRKRYLPESIDKWEWTGDNKIRITEPATVHAFVGDPKKTDHHVHRGGMPVLNERGEHVTSNAGGMKLFKFPMAMHQARVKASQDEAIELTERQLAARPQLTSDEKESVGMVESEITRQEGRAEVEKQ